MTDVHITDRQPRPDQPALCVAIPAYNEADGIAEFLDELDSVLHRESWSHRIVVADDCSTDDTIEAIEKIATELHGEVVVVPGDINRGHGPTVLTAYRHALASGADLILQVDGDGQFHAEDICLLIEAQGKGANIVTGRRSTRVDPWFRKALTVALRSFMLFGFNVRRQDTNCPLRLYTSEALESILVDVPPRALVPHVYMSVLEARSGFTHREVSVRHRVRRGANPTGTMWGEARPQMVPRRLIKFVRSALGEALEFRRTVGSRRPAGRAPARRTRVEA